jgi:hypothetical protein
LVNSSLPILSPSMQTGVDVSIAKIFIDLLFVRTPSQFSKYSPRKFFLLYLIWQSKYGDYCVDALSIFSKNLCASSSEEVHCISGRLALKTPP